MLFTLIANIGSWTYDAFKGKADQTNTITVVKNYLDK